MNFYNNKKVAVTGGTGFIGSRIAERLAFEEGAIVNVLVLTWNKATWVSRADVNLIKGDVTNKESLELLLKDVDIVFHCAISGNYASARSVNIEGTRNVLEACEKCGVKRVVHFSTIGVHGPYIEEGMDENAPFIKMGNVYADSKIEAEELFWEFISSRNIEGVVIRPTYVWGPNSTWFTVAPVKNIINRQFVFVDGGKGACNAVYVDNVVDLALISGTHPQAAGEAFLIRDNERITWGDFFEYYAKIIHVDPAGLMSIDSQQSANAKMIMNRKVQKFLKNADNTLLKLIAEFEDCWPKLVRYGLKAPRKLMQIGRTITERVAPTYNWWDIKKYSSPGYISINKAARLLDYEPRLSIKEGMNNTEVWLRAQNYIKN